LRERNLSRGLAALPLQIETAPDAGREDLAKGGVERQMGLETQMRPSTWPSPMFASG
jgi:hypothetical protein